MMEFSQNEERGTVDAEIERIKAVNAAARDNLSLVFGCDRDMLFYISAHHSTAPWDEEGEIVDVQAYWDGGDMMLGEDSDDGYEQDIYRTMQDAREWGWKYVCFA